MNRFAAIIVSAALSLSLWAMGDAQAQTFSSPGVGFPLTASGWSSVTAPLLTTTNSTTSGFGIYSNRGCALLAGTTYVCFSSNGVLQTTPGCENWVANNNPVDGTIDTTLCRAAAGVVQINAGSGAGATGTIKAAAFLPGILYSAAGTALPSCVAGLKGQEAVVTDATGPTFLANYTSGGAVVAPVMCNGSNWVTY